MTYEEDRARINAYRRQKYASDPEFREKSRQNCKRCYQKMMTDPERKQVHYGNVKKRFRKRCDTEPGFRAKVLEKMRVRVKDYENRRKDDPETIIAYCRNQYIQICDKDSDEAKRLLAEIEAEEGKEFRELLLDGIPEKKGIKPVSEGE